MLNKRPKSAISSAGARKKQFANTRAHAQVPLAIDGALLERLSHAVAPAAPFALHSDRPNQPHATSSAPSNSHPTSRSSTQQADLTHVPVAGVPSAKQVANESILALETTPTNKAPGRTNDSSQVSLSQFFLVSQFLIICLPMK